MVPEPVSPLHDTIAASILSCGDESDGQPLTPLLPARLEHPSSPRRPHAGTESVSSLSLSLLRLIRTLGHENPLPLVAVGYSNYYYSLPARQLSNATGGCATCPAPPQSQPAPGHEGRGARHGEDAGGSTSQGGDATGGHGVPQRSASLATSLVRGSA
jgi:hypothetical protein